MSNLPSWRRRALLAGGAVAIVTWVKTAPYLLSFRDPELDFEDIDGLAPFRRVVGSRPTTTAGSIFAGLDAQAPTTTKDEEIQRMVRGNPCTAFFGTRQIGSVPLAMFSDFACPICKTMNRRLAEIEANAPGSFHLVRHELPLLGVASEIASRAVLAAERQDAYLELHERLSRTPAVTDEAFVARIADDIGLNSNKLLRDMNSAEVTQALSVSRAIADVFGFYGTPAFAVGRTVFLGSMSVSSLEWLIANEVEKPC